MPYEYYPQMDCIHTLPRFHIDVPHLLRGDSLIASSDVSTGDAGKPTSAQNDTSG